MLLLHGQPGTSADWSEVVDLLAGRFRVLAPDRPGYGRTGGPAGDFDTNAAAVLSHLDRAGVARAVVVGHSWGGAVALRTARLAPERVAGLVLAASVGGDAPTGLDRVLALRPVGGVLSVLGAAGTSRLLGSGALGRRLRQGLPPARSRSLEALALPVTARQAWRSFAAEQRAFVAGAAGILDGAAELACPVDVVVGTLDRVVGPESSRRLAGALPGARLVPVAGVGHLLPQDAPGALAGSVTDVARRAGLLSPRQERPLRPET